MQVAPLLRASEVRALRELIRAAPAVWPYPGHGTLAGKESRAKAGGDAEALTPKAEPVSRPGRGRSRPATSEIMGVTAGETAPIPEARDERISRAKMVRKPAAIDWNRVADAHARQAMEPQNSHIGPLRPLPVAFSPEECRRCGIPGRKGCAHQLAYVAAQIAESPYSTAKLHGTGARK